MFGQARLLVFDTGQARGQCVKILRRKLDTIRIVCKESDNTDGSLYDNKRLSRIESAYSTKTRPLSSLFLYVQMSVVMLSDSEAQEVHCLLQILGAVWFSGGFFLACEDFRRLFNHSFPACAGFFFLKRRLARAH